MSVEEFEKAKRILVQTARRLAQEIGGDPEEIREEYDLVKYRLFYQLEELSRWGHIELEDAVRLPDFPQPYEKQIRKRLDRLIEGRSPIGFH